MKHLVIAILFTTQISQASWILKGVRSGDGLTPVDISEAAPSSNLTPEKLRFFPRFHAEDSKSSEEMYEEILWPQQEAPASFARLLKTSRWERGLGTEVRTIIEQGPAANRICLTFLGDGYRDSEKEKFFKDVELMVDDLFNGKTFASYTSLFNVYAVFVPSVDSGITDIQKKNTAFGLFRSPAGSKRAIMPGNTMAIDHAIRLAPKTDYPVIIANDDYYGGLGGQYAITTSSRQSGKIVLRHELGHNFGDVGEEYDGGMVYRGANASATPSVPWTQWLKSPSATVQDARFLGGAYVWKNLKQGPVVQKFNFPQPTNGGNFWFEVQLSSVGWQSLNDVEILLDGATLEIDGIGTEDRSFFNTKRIQGVTPGSHTLEIREVNHDGDNILAFANLYAYVPQYDFGNLISAYKTYDDEQNITYRPTHDKCIMRDMLMENFCAIDQENMWLQFLKRIRLIDSVNTAGVNVELKHLPNLPIAITWYQKSGTAWQEILEGKDSEVLNKSKLPNGTYKVSVELKHPEIRKSNPRLKDEIEFSL